jgi:hypothetical protein
MTGPDSTSFNYAGGDAHVFVQAQGIYGDVTTIDGGQTVVHGDARFEISPGASPADKYRVGVNNLTSGMAPRARDLIWEAMMDEYISSEVLFHWQVAMLSGRTIRQFSDEEISQLKKAEEQRRFVIAGDPWAEGTRLVFRLLESVGLLPKTPQPDMSDVLTEFDVLDARQREMLLPHLELFLDDPRKDDIWRQERSAAEAGRLSGDRKNRAWMFFQPEPAQPRPRPVFSRSTTPSQRRVAWASTGICVGALGYLGWELLWHDAALGLLGYLIALAGGAVAAVNGLELRFLAERRRLKDEQLQAPRPGAPHPPPDGFADRVDALFRGYAPTYLHKEERAAWEAATAGIRKLDRDEIVTGYRESRIVADQVAWLIRYRIRQSRNRWRDGTLYDHRERLAPRPGTMTACRAGIVVAILGGIGAIIALRAYPLADAAGVIVALPSSIWAWRNWLRIDLERRRFAADEEESGQRLADDRQEWARWSGRLERRPSDFEMAAWLECDRTALLGQAIDHYKLARHQVITHAFLEEAGPRAKRARVRNGPTRYSRYKLIVFLLTSDGVRQMSADLGFVSVTLRKGDRISYRYDAVASAHVSLKPHATEGTRIGQEFKLTLVNGEPISVIVTDLDPEDFEQGEDADSLSRATLDAASVANTLHVLEGIAAEGRAWLQERKMG